MQKEFITYSALRLVAIHNTLSVETERQGT